MSGRQQAAVLLPVIYHCQVLAKKQQSSRIWISPGLSLGSCSTAGLGGQSPELQECQAMAVAQTTPHLGYSYEKHPVLSLGLHLVTEPHCSSRTFSNVVVLMQNSQKILQKNPHLFRASDKPEALCYTGDTGCVTQDKDSVCREQRRTFKAIQIGVR